METYDSLQLAIRVETALGNAYHDALVAIYGDEAVNKFASDHDGNMALMVLYLHYKQARVNVSRLTTEETTMIQVDREDMESIQYAVWVVHEHNRFHFGADHNTVDLTSGALNLINDIMDRSHKGTTNDE